MRIILLLAAPVLLICCNDEDYSIGVDYFDGISLGYNTWDTLTVDLSTVRLDSFATTYPSALLAGHMNHHIYGMVDVRTYLQLTLDSTSVELEKEDARYDSITMVLSYSGYYLQDTTQVYEVIVEELEESITLNEETNYLYNTTEFAVKNTALAQMALLPRPNGAPVEITISDSLGLRFYEEALKSDNELNSVDFLDFFKGLRISVSEETEMVLGFETNVELRVYYTDLTAIPAEQRYFSFSNKNEGELFFNHITSNYSLTDLAPLSTTDTSLSAANLSNLAYMQSGIGLAIRLEMPHLKKLAEDNESMLIRDVVLRLRPMANLYPRDADLPVQLAAYWVDEKNQFINTSAIPFNLSLDDEFDLDTYYQADITAFVNYQLEEDENNQNALLLVATDLPFSSSVHYVAVGDQHHERYRAEINLNIIQLKDE